MTTLPKKPIQVTQELSLAKIFPYEKNEGIDPGIDIDASVKKLIAGLKEDYIETVKSVAGNINHEVNVYYNDKATPAATEINIRLGDYHVNEDDFNLITQLLNEGYEKIRYEGSWIVWKRFMDCLELATTKTDEIKTTDNVMKDYEPEWRVTSYDYASVYTLNFNNVGTFIISKSVRESAPYLTVMVDTTGTMWSLTSYADPKVSLSTPGEFSSYVMKYGHKSHGSVTR